MLISHRVCRELLFLYAPLTPTVFLFQHSLLSTAAGVFFKWFFFPDVNIQASFASLLHPHVTVLLFLTIKLAKRAYQILGFYGKWIITFILHLCSKCNADFSINSNILDIWVMGWNKRKKSYVQVSKLHPLEIPLTAEWSLQLGTIDKGKRNSLEPVKKRVKSEQYPRNVNRKKILFSLLVGWITSRRFANTLWIVWGSQVEP